MTAVATPAQEREIPSPAVTPDIAAYFEAAAEGRLLIKGCRACGRLHHYPRSICPHCMSDDTGWVPSRGEGRVYTYSVLRVGTPTPFALAYVRLDEGVTMMTNIVDCDLDALRVDLPVRVVFKPSADGTMVPMFAPTGAPGRGP